ncbi:alpha/beta fold hydrolase [Actinacidiphila glaucinigra]|uniref:Pimeloyl-ACP methyl ester carboxylesterase n=1 Tax=Actinacidiphila glaucinigra TaxID=235986 RepID=A0A239JTV8_9ACTN|nr:alpha/beta hydrolase [Actinacidiphila glaucinigra]SNT08314.1 Pimeloyl-ACP methyl ester carboxylesterase [Actinacidiphila glaucinigra]
MLRRRTFRTAVLGATGVALAGGVTAFASAAPAHHTPSAPKPTVVLVNGAWSDAASWKSVINRLQTDGYPVVAPPTGLRGVSADSSYLASYLKTIQGPVVLVGQSYGGTVITNAATGNKNVKALVYISAFAPDKGEDVKTLTAKFPGSQISNDPDAEVPTALTPVPYTKADGTTGVDLYAKADQYRNLFLSNRVSGRTAAELAATQSPAAPEALGEASGDPAWKTIQSWYLVSKDDHVIPPATERFMAKRAHAHTVEADTPHAAQVTNPGIVTDLIKKAAATVH